MSLFQKIAIIGIVWVGIEIFLSIFHKSICTTSGCTIAASYNRYPELVMLLIGILIFIILFILKAKRQDKLLDIILIGVLASEGYLQAFEIFSVHTFCIFCTGVFLTVLGLFITRAIENKEILLKGLFSFLFVFFTVFLINNPTLNIKNQYTLLYLPGCPHCEHTEELLNQNKIPYQKINASYHKGLLISMGIEEAPVMFVKTSYGYKILVGSSNIESFFNNKNTLNNSNNINIGNNGCQLNNIFGNSCK